MIRLVPVLLLLAIIILVASCDSEPTPGTQFELVKFFNLEGKYPRFLNSSLIFGDTLSKEQRAVLKLDSIWLGGRVYRKAAYAISTNVDSALYFMYGLSMEDSILNEVRIRSFKGDSLIGDFLVIDLGKDHSLSYDYWYDDQYDNPRLIVVATNHSKETHYSYYELDRGEIVDITEVPDTIFRRHDLVPKIGQGVRVYDDFNNKTLRLGPENRLVEGKIVKVFRGEDCKTNLLLQLSDTLMGYKYVLTAVDFDSLVGIYGVQNDILVEGEEACLKVSAKPQGEKVLLIERAFVDQH